MIVKQLDYDRTPVTGPALVGHYLKRLAPVFKQIDAAWPVKGGVANGDILRSYVGLLVQGKSDFDAIESFRGDTFFKYALGIDLLPSSPTLRQRMDARAADWFDSLLTLDESLLSRKCGFATFLDPRGGRAPQGGVLGALMGALPKSVGPKRARPDCGDCERGSSIFQSAAPPTRLTTDRDSV